MTSDKDVGSDSVISQLDEAYMNTRSGPEFAEDVHELESRCVITQSCKSNGPICPPMTSCMRVTRNSYFS
ncbi:GH21246 [Drosophila grimshawi]|uniref:GH21246 n=2 Tax=Drosophila grimshawi TaxID=7222 RepID=B4J7H4_DROGR|nr:GH21246 [Drosophila grimshawi]